MKLGRCSLIAVTGKTRGTIAGHCAYITGNNVNFTDTMASYFSNKYIPLTIHEYIRRIKKFRRSS